MNVGNQNKTLFKYLIYIYVLLQQRQLEPPFVNVGLRDTELESKFSINRDSFTKIMTYQGIIARTSESYAYHNIHIAYKYAIDVDRYYELFYELINSNDVTKLLKPLPFDCGNLMTPVLMSRKYCNTKWKLWDKEEKERLYNLIKRLISQAIFYFFEGNSGYPSVSDVVFLNGNFEELEVPAGIYKTTLSNIEKQNLQSLVPFTVKTARRWDDDQKEYYSEYYKHLLSETTLLKVLTKELTAARASGQTVNCNLHFSLKELKTGYRFKASCRQSNPYCHVEKAARKVLFDDEGFTSNFDLHSAIFAVARLMNTGTFDPDWDIKTDILKLGLTQENGQILTRDDIKPLLMRVFFRKSIDEAYSHYRHAYLKKEISVNISKDTLEKLCAACELQTGEISKYYNNIFLIESVLELKTINALLDRECQVRNVYDCFYFRPEEISVNDVKKIVAEQAQNTYKILNGI